MYQGLRQHDAVGLTRSSTVKDYVEEGLVLAGMVVVLLSIMFVAAATIA
jgi:hypothetical protein